jgi:hypothetical protein
MHKTNRHFRHIASQDVLSRIRIQKREGEHIPDTKGLKKTNPPSIRNHARNAMSSTLSVVKQNVQHAKGHWRTLLSSSVWGNRLHVCSIELWNVTWKTLPSSGLRAKGSRVEGLGSRGMLPGRRCRARGSHRRAFSKENLGFEVWVWSGGG